jgi:hypothetical protein
LTHGAILTPFLFAGRVRLLQFVAAPLADSATALLFGAVVILALAIARSSDSTGANCRTASANKPAARLLAAASKPDVA